MGILSADMSKAFDSLHPPLMLCKLKAYGFQDRALDLLSSYLCSRLGRVRIGSVTSSWRIVERGCPSGIGARTAIVEHFPERSYIQCRFWAINVRGRSPDLRERKGHVYRSRETSRECHSSN